VGENALKTEFFNMLSLKLPISGIKVVGFSHWLLKNLVFSVDSSVKNSSFANFEKG